MMHDVFISRSTGRPALQRLRSIAGVLLAVGLPLGIVSCKPTENTAAPETQETSAGDANAARVAKDFGPTLLTIASQYSITDHDTYYSLSASHYGFVDLNGKVVIEPQWDEVSGPQSEVAGFSDGVAAVKRDGKWGWIDKTGRLFLPPLSSPPNFHEGLLPFERDGKWGYMDTTGTVVIQPEWEEAGEFSGGYAGVKRGGKWGGIDKTGRLVLPLGNYEGGLYFDPQPGLWNITVGKKPAYMDRAGRVVIKPQRDVVWVLWSEGLLVVIREREGKWGFIDKTGKVVVPLEWEQAGPFYEGLAPVQRNEKWGFIDKTGKVVIEPQWEDADRFHQGLAGVQRNGKWGFIDKTGKVMIEPRWDEVGRFHQELAFVKEDKKFGFIDRTGRVVIEPQWDIAKYYQETQDENAPVYWLVAREEKKAEPSPGGTAENQPAHWFFKQQSQPTVRAVWMDSAGKQIWSSDNSNNSINKDALKSPPPSVSPGQHNH